MTEKDRKLIADIGRMVGKMGEKFDNHIDGDKVSDIKYKPNSFVQPPTQKIEFGDNYEIKMISDLPLEAFDKSTFSVEVSKLLSQYKIKDLIVNRK